MNQLFIPSLEVDVLASSIRRQKRLFEDLIKDLENGFASEQETKSRLKEIEKGLSRLCAA